MGKLIPALMATGGATAVSVGGVCLARNSGTGDGGNQQAEANPPAGSAAPGQPSVSQAQTKQPLKLEFENLDEFKEQPTKSTCVTGYFSTLENKDQAKEISDSDKPTEGTEFFATTSDDSAIKSCLKIEYKKTTYKDDKWTGKFTWLWTFTTGTEGFISFNIAETFEEASKLKFDGIFYLVKQKTTGGGEWNIEYKKSISGDKKIDQGNLDTHFPKPSSELSSAVQPYWGFLDSGSDLTKICHEDSCKVSGTSPTSPIKKELSWTKGTDSDKLLKDWAEDLNWWTSLYTDDNWALGTKISPFKGKWTLKTQQ